MVTIDVVYEIIETGESRIDTVTTDETRIGLPTVVKALTGIDIAGADPFPDYHWYKRGWDGRISQKMAPTIRVKSLRVVADSVFIGYEDTLSASNATEDKYTFAHMKYLEEVEIIADWCIIGHSAFSGCSSLRSISIPGSISSIGGHAFLGCGSLVSVNIPRMHAIGPGAFERCGSLLALESISQLKTIEADSFRMCRTMIDVEDPEDPLVRTVSGVRFATAPLSVSGVYTLALCGQTDEAQRRRFEELASKTPEKAGTLIHSQAIGEGDSLRKYLKLIVDAETGLLQLIEALALAASRKALLEEGARRRAAIDSRSSEFAKWRTDRQALVEHLIWERNRREILEGRRLDSQALSRIGEKPKMTHTFEEPPSKPSEPSYKAPGLFNRKAVEKRNAQLKLQYNEALARYELQLAEYKQSRSREAKAMADWKKRLDIEISRQISELGPYVEERHVVECSDDTVSVVLNAALRASEEMCSQLETQLVETASLLKSAYSAGVIHPKYQSFAAMATIYEYVETGRCLSLRGKDGAYNLYESERRQNVIIGKLDEISGKLDELRENQYMIYTAVKGIGSRLDSMSHTLTEVLDEAKKTRATVEEISDKASALVANSSSISYWAKRNAELTDSLGYLIAFSVQ